MIKRRVSQDWLVEVQKVSSWVHIERIWTQTHITNTEVIFKTLAVSLIVLKRPHRLWLWLRYSR